MNRFYQGKNAIFFTANESSEKINLQNYRTALAEMAMIHF